MFAANVVRCCNPFDDYVAGAVVVESIRLNHVVLRMHSCKRRRLTIVVDEECSCFVADADSYSQNCSHGNGVVLERRGVVESTDMVDLVVQIGLVATCIDCSIMLFQLVVQIQRD